MKTRRSSPRRLGISSAGEFFVVSDGTAELLSPGIHAIGWLFSTRLLGTQAGESEFTVHNHCRAALFLYTKTAKHRDLNHEAVICPVSEAVRITHDTADTAAQQPGVSILRFSL